MSTRRPAPEKLRKELHRLIDELTNDDLYGAKRFLGYLRASRDPVLRSLLEAPYDDEPLTPEEAAALDEGWEALANGDVLSDEEVKRRLEL